MNYTEMESKVRMRPLARSSPSNAARGILRDTMLTHGRFGKLQTMNLGVRRLR
jgi:hypothetical protein